MASWKATGLLEARWSSVGGRDGLAAKTGIQPGTISGYNTGRLPLGMRNAKKIADALGVSVFDLGAPAETAQDQGLTVFDRLEALEGQADRNRDAIERILKALDGAGIAVPDAA